MKKQSGFSTIEILIAVTILALVVLIFTQGRKILSSSMDNEAATVEAEGLAMELFNQINQTGKRALSCAVVSGALECLGIKLAAAQCSTPKVRFSFMPAPNYKMSYGCQVGAGWTELKSYPRVNNFVLCDDAKMKIVGVGGCSIPGTGINILRAMMTSNPNRYFRFSLSMQVSFSKSQSHTSEFQSAFFVRNPIGIPGVVFQ